MLANLRQSCSKHLPSNPSCHSVVDAYAEWCGPCHALEGALRTFKTECNDDLLLYATVSALSCMVMGKVHTDLTP